MSGKYFEIDDSKDTFVSFDCTPKKCSVQVHAKPIDAISICGAAVGSAIETYFRLADEADIPKEVALKPLKIAIETAFDVSGIDADLDVEVREGED